MDAIATDERVEEQEEKREQQPEKSVSSDLIRGHINTIILRSLYDGDKYGYEIIAEIEHKSHGQYSLKQPSLYSALKRLEKDGYVTSYWGGSVGGGRRKYFSLTEAGKIVSEQNQAEWEYSRTVIDSLISDKDFDFSNPAPTSVNMRVLRDTTSRVPRGEGEDDELDFEPTFDDSEDFKKLEQEVAARRAQLDADAARFEEEMRARNDALLRERNWREQEIAARENALESKRAELEALRAQLDAKEARDDAAQRTEIAALETRVTELTEELENAKHELADLAEREEAARLRADETSEQTLKEQQELLETERRLYSERLEETQRQSEDTLAEERRNAEARENELRRVAQEQLDEERRRSEALLEAERKRHEEDLKAQEARILAEQEEMFRRREKELLHRNYLDLVNAPPPEEETHDYTYYSMQPDPAEEPAPAETEDYKTVVHRLYANALAPETAPPAEERAQSLDGIDFTDLEARAAQDGIRVRTAGGKMRSHAEITESIVHKGKALFISGIITFVFCVVLGSILLGVQASAGLPAFYPYFIWCVGLVVLLVTGLAYANHYGERALRRTGPVLLNTVVAYVLLVIITLIVALTARADLSDSAQLATFVIVPIVFFLGVVLFGVTYYVQVRPKKE